MVSFLIVIFSYSGFIPILKYLNLFNLSNYSLILISYAIMGWECLSAVSPTIECNHFMFRFFPRFQPCKYATRYVQTLDCNCMKPVQISKMGLAKFSLFLIFVSLLSERCDAAQDIAIDPKGYIIYCPCMGELCLRFLILIEKYLRQIRQSNRPHHWRAQLCSIYGPDTRSAQFHRIQTP